MIVVTPAGRKRVTGGLTGSAVSIHNTDGPHPSPGTPTTTTPFRTARRHDDDLGFCLQQQQRQQSGSNTGDATRLEDGSTAVKNSTVSGDDTANRGVRALRMRASWKFR